MISVIIPCYNHGLALSICLDSLVKQSFKDLEIIIVNDGSSDDTEKIVDDYIKSSGGDCKIKYLKTEHHGAPAARNAGASRAHGEYLLFADADLIFAKDALQKMLDALRDNQSASYAYSAFRFGWKKFSSRPFDIGVLKDNNYIHTSALIRREHFPGFDESLERFQDWDLWLTMLEQGHVGKYIPEVLFTATITKKGISKWRPRAWYKICLLIFGWTGLAPRPFRRFVHAKKIVQKKHGLI